MNLKRLLLFVLLMFSFEQMASAQKKKKEEVTPPSPPKTETPSKKPEPKKGPKTYNEFVDSTFTVQKGLMPVLKKDDKWYFEVADSLIDREIMTITRFSKTAAGGGIFGGEEVNRQVIKWEKGLSDNLLMRSITYVLMSPDSTKPMAQAVKNSSADPIVASLSILAIKKDSASKKPVSYIVEVGPIFDADLQTFSLDPIAKQRFNIMAFQKDKSFIQKMVAYQINNEIRTTKTFSVTPPRVSLVPIPQFGSYLPSSLDAGVITMEFNTSMILLPKYPMRKRTFDARVGFFANQFSVFSEESQQAEKEVFAVRWKLEPKSKADADAQKRGELIEPAKQIVYYIDPATPLKWRKYLKLGVDDWNVAFEKAGWKNAIKGEYWPENDSTMSLEDARYSVIRYFAADIQNAYGPNVHDPRSGEIIESHIGWYHNVMRLLRNWYMIQTAAVDPNARKKDFDDELMGQLIRFVSSHEVGHTLGLRHNMGASSATPVEKLRDKNWVAANGHTSSIMDYARFNYVAQPEDGVTDLFPRIGDYDKWAIKWGYSFISDEKSEKETLNNWTKEAYLNPRLRFGTEISPYDPRYQTEDIGDNAMKASNYGIKNLVRIVPNLVDWSKENGESYQELEELYGNVVSQYRRYIGHVSKNIGGIFDDPKTYDMPGNQFTVVPKSLQKEAVSFLNDQLFKTPTWLMDQSVLAKIKPENGVEALKDIQDKTLENLLAGDRLVRLMETGSVSNSNYNLDEYFQDLKSGIFGELKSGTGIDMYRRNLQKVYVRQMIGLLTPGKASVRSIPVGVTYGFATRTVDLSTTDLPSITRGQLEALQLEIKSVLPRFTDKLSKYHLKDILDRIDSALNPK